MFSGAASELPLCALISGTLRSSTLPNGFFATPMNIYTRINIPDITTPTHVLIFPASLILTGLSSIFPVFSDTLHTLPNSLLYLKNMLVIAKYDAGADMSASISVIIFLNALITVRYTAIPAWVKLSILIPTITTSEITRKSTPTIALTNTFQKSIRRIVLTVLP